MVHDDFIGGKKMVSKYSPVTTFEKPNMEIVAPIGFIIICSLDSNTNNMSIYSFTYSYGSADLIMCIGGGCLF